MPLPFCTSQRVRLVLGMPCLTLKPVSWTLGQGAGRQARRGNCVAARRKPRKPSSLVWRWHVQTKGIPGVGSLIWPSLQTFCPVDLAENRTGRHAHLFSLDR
ncbi:hypothetical protein EV126DRAFT_432990 [Verticillium dahliae]|nr:hypothetical protein EV126DRAFT_435046 [Verticillium dahliae]KAH6687673.1 hypothetical protein EV126DRAFT_432990 [Verticillium dahliae]